MTKSRKVGERFDDRQATLGTPTDGKEAPIKTYCGACGGLIPSGARRCLRCGEPAPRSLKEAIGAAEWSMRECAAVFKAGKEMLAKLEREAPALKAKQDEMTRDAIRKMEQRYAEDYAARGLSLNGFLATDTLRKEDAVPLPHGLRILGEPE